MVSPDLYPARPRPRTIRLLELVSAPDANVSEYKFREHCLDNELCFEALSYVWGDTTVRKELIIDAQTVEVTVNLWNALQHLSSRSAHPPLWVDAICINQEDLVEREEQASLVSEIYGGATRVLVWLGSDQDGECTEAPGLVKLIYTECDRRAKDQGCDVLPYAHKLAREAEDQALLDVSISQIEAAMVEANVPELAWNSLRKLFDNRWFTRIWCVQEIGFAQSGVLMLGAMEPIPWEWLAVVTAWYKAHDLNSSNLPSKMKGVMYYYALYMFIGVQVDGHEGAEALVAALWRFHPFQATDPRDKVYGLMGLLRKGGIKVPLEVRYVDTSVADVYASVAMALINERRDLKILAFIHHTSADIDTELSDGMPSWVPRWDRGPGLSALNRNFRPGVVTTACGPHIYAEISASPPRTLQLTGLSFDQVDFVSRLMDGDLFNLRDETESESWAGLGLFIDLWNRATADGTDDGALERLARTLTGDYQGRGLHEALDEEREQFQASFLGWMALVFKKRGVHSQTGVSPLDVLKGREAYPGLFAKHARSACHGRRVFWTKLGFLGLGPPGMEGDHEVAVLKGGSTPYVLKQRGDGWLYLGESYIDGIMFGECFSSKVPGWARPKEQVFRIL